MMCAYDPGKGPCDDDDCAGNGPCGGDDGGPLFDATENVLVGIVSYYYCGGSVPSVFSQIANQWTWIKTTICADHSNPKPDFCSQRKESTKPARPSMKLKKPANKKKGGKTGKGGKTTGKLL